MASLIVYDFNGWVRRIVIAIFLDILGHSLHKIPINYVCGQVTADSEQPCEKATEASRSWLHQLLGLVNELSWRQMLLIPETTIASVATS